MRQNDGFVGDADNFFKKCGLGATTETMVLTKKKMRNKAVLVFVWLKESY